jgi:hypothetical protein
MPLNKRLEALLKMVDSTTQYKHRFQEAWEADKRFSETYEADATKILLTELATLLNYEAKIGETPNPMDKKGYDRQIRLDFGFGVRILDHDKVLRWGTFTVDIHEWEHEIRDRHYYYFFGAGLRPEVGNDLTFWMIFDFCRLKELVKQQKISFEIKQNRTHSLESFYCFRIVDIVANRLVVSYDGQNYMIAKFGLPTTHPTRIDREEVA